MGVLVAFSKSWPPSEILTPSSLLRCLLTTSSSATSMGSAALARSAFRWAASCLRWAFCPSVLTSRLVDLVSFATSAFGAIGAGDWLSLIFGLVPIPSPNVFSVCLCSCALYWLSVGAYSRAFASATGLEGLCFGPVSCDDDLLTVCSARSRTLRSFFAAFRILAASSGRSTNPIRAPVISRFCFFPP